MTETTIVTAPDQGGTARTILAAAQATVRALEERRRREARERAERAAAEAALSAAVLVRKRLGDAAAPLHDAEAWTGYPSVDPDITLTGVAAPASAIAWLGESGDGTGIWLHFAYEPQLSGVDGRLAVVTRCGCGRYREREVGHVHALADALAEASDAGCLPGKRPAAVDHHQAPPEAAHPDSVRRFLHARPATRGRSENP